jgi:hypothetical protein
MCIKEDTDANGALVDKYLAPVKILRWDEPAAHKQSLCSQSRGRLYVQSPMDWKGNKLTTLLKQGDLSNRSLPINDMRRY